jgi:glutamate--cysteine ligase
MVELREWGAQLLAECGPIARALDEAHGAVHEKSAHRDALAAAVSALDNPDSLPSARMLREMSERYDNSYSRFALAKSIEHRRALVSEPLPAEAEALFARLAEKSVRVQREIEAADKIPFETFRQRYLSHESLRT